MYTIAIPFLLSNVVWHALPFVLFSVAYKHKWLKSNNTVNSTKWAAIICLQLLCTWLCFWESNIYAWLVKNSNFEVTEIRPHTDNLFTRLWRTGSCSLAFLLQNNVKIILFTCSQKKNIDSNLLNHFLSRKGLCKKVSTFTFTPEKTKARIMSCIISFIMSHLVKYVTEREELQERIWGQNQCMYFFSVVYLEYI